jgi:hypothetical protein
LVAFVQDSDLGEQQVHTSTVTRESCRCLCAFSCAASLGNGFYDNNGKLKQLGSDKGNLISEQNK